MQDEPRAEAATVAPRTVLIPDVVPSRGPVPADRVPSQLGPPSPGVGLAASETSLPSGDPLSTRTWAEEGPWAGFGWGDGDYPADLLLDSDLRR